MSKLKALKFMKLLNSSKDLSDIVQKKTLHTGRMEYNLYEKGSPKKCILLVHGIAPDGNADYRFVNLSNYLAVCGYRVVTPLFRDLADFSIGSDSIDEIAHAIEYFSSHRSICPSGQLGLFSLSISAGMSLIAASRADTASLVSSLFLIGSYGDVGTVVKYLMEEDDIDEYGRVIILKNFFCGGPGENKSLKRAFDIAAEDNVYLREEPELPSFLETLPDNERSLYHRLTEDKEFRIEQYKKAQKTHSSLIEELSVIKNIAAISAKVFLVHGREDPVIPSSESQNIYKKLEEIGAEASMIISPLIGHSETEMGLQAIPETMKLINIFADYLKNI